MTADQVRTDFQGLGYQVDAPTTWWTNSGVTTFTVSDRSDQASAGGRMLMVLVYPDTATARAEIGQAQACELDTAELLVGAPAPHLVPGYGPSILVHNVALVESTQQDLAQRYAAQLDRRALLRSVGAVGASLAGLTLVSSACGPLTFQTAARVPRIGYLSPGPREAWVVQDGGFLQGLRDLGYMEGRTNRHRLALLGGGQ